MTFSTSSSTSTPAPAPAKVANQSASAMRAGSVVLALAVTALLVACNSYNPDLGNAPFRCNETSPRCPDDYVCVNYDNGREVCEEDGDGGGDVDAGGGNVTCNDDSEIEPNNDTTSPTNTTIPLQELTYSLVGLAICPATDVDVFRFSTDVRDRNLKAEISFDESVTTLQLEVLNNTGTTIRMGTPVSGSPGVVRAEVRSLPLGDYFVSVRSSNATENNYSIELDISVP